MKKAIFLVALLIATLPLTVRAEQKVSVSIHGVNYSNEDFSFSLIDPQDPKNEGSGELVGRYSGGGTVCCYALPKTWHPGIKIVIKSQHWLKRSADGNLPEINETHTVEVPRYADDKVSDLWVLRQQDGSYTVVSSRYQPNHEKWPGLIKGWPVPTIEYRNERLAQELELEEYTLKVLEKAAKELEDDPISHAKKMWPVLINSNLIETSTYSGPEDDRFQQYLRNTNSDQIKWHRERIEVLRSYNR